MKKLLLTTLLFAGLAVSAQSATDKWNVDWNDDTNVNLAGNQKVMVSSISGEQWKAENITDGNLGTRWQAKAQIKETDPDYNDWVLIEFEDQKNISVVEIKWEASRASSFSIYLTDEKVDYDTIKLGDNEYYVITPQWLASHSPVAIHGTEGEGGDYISTTLVKGEGKYLLVYCTDYNPNGKNYGASIYELKAGNVDIENQISDISLANIKTYPGIENEVTVNAVNQFNQVITQFGEEAEITLSCDNTLVEITNGKEKGHFIVKATQVGNYTLSATATFGPDKVYSTQAFIKATIDWASTENIAEGKALMGRLKGENSDYQDYEYLPAKATDGDIDTYYEYNGEYNGGESWVILDFEEEKEITAVEVLFGKTSNGTFAISYGNEFTTEENLTIDSSWSTFNTTLKWETIESLERDSNEISTYIFPQAIRARYLVIYDKSNPSGKPQYREIMVASETIREEEVPTSIQLEVSDNFVGSDERIKLTATVYNQFEEVMNIESGLTYKCDDNIISENAGSRMDYAINDANGSYIFTASFENLTSNECLVEVVAQSTRKISEIGYTVKINGNDVEDRDKDIFKGIQQGHLLEGYKLSYEFSDIYDFDLINIKWEAACPADYTVTAVYYDGSSKIILEDSGREYIAGFNPIDRIFATESKAELRRKVNSVLQSSDLSQIKALEIVPTKKASQWEVQLYGLDLYGAKNTSTGVETIENYEQLIDVYTLSGVRVADKVNFEEIRSTLAPGLYIVGNKKMIIR